MELFSVIIMRASFIIGPWSNFYPAFIWTLNRWNLFDDQRTQFCAIQFFVMPIFKRPCSGHLAHVGVGGLLTPSAPADVAHVAVAVTNNLVGLHQLN